MRRATNDILTREQPVSPAETADVVQRAQEENCGLGVLDGVFLDAKFFGLFADVGEEFTVGKGAIGAEFVEDLGEGVFPAWGSRRGGRGGGSGFG